WAFHRQGDHRPPSGPSRHQERGGAGDDLRHLFPGAPRGLGERGPYFMRLSAMLQAAGPMSTTNSVGMMKTIRGMVMTAGSRAAFSSARIMRSLRNSAERTRKDWASGVPYFSA